MKTPKQKAQERLREVIKQKDNQEIEQRITDLETELYNFNSQVVSLQWIALNKNITKTDAEYLNNLLGRTIQLLRNIKEDG